jgi:hypothetical protein
MVRSKLARALALTFVLSLGCARLVPLAPASAVLLPQAQEQEGVRAAIARAMTSRQYVAESETPGRIVARYSRGGATLRLAIAYSGTQYEISYLDSQGFDYVVDRRGQTLIGAGYPRQVRALAQAIEGEIGRPAREAAEAVERQRQQELALAQQETARQQAALDAQAREQQAQRNAQLETERLRTERVRAQAEANRPVVIAAQPAPVQAPAQPSPRYAVIRQFGRSYTGQAGGSTSAAGLRFPSYCTGFYPDAPSHLMRLQRGAHARVDVHAGIDTVLAIVGEDGSVWCDDDSGGDVDPAIEGDFAAGNYFVWVGSYRTGYQAPYELTLGQGAQTYVQAPAEPVRDPDCAQAMIRAGYSSSIGNCMGVETQCALAMINAGYPSSVPNCRGVDSQCAVTMVQAGYPSSVPNCQGVEPACALAMIQQGYPSRVAECR